jgi:aspartyl-tRNA(Asn)/glutamyl-tRNA(Gln) amidotransferase subunit B
MVNNPLPDDTSAKDLAKIINAEQDKFDLGEREVKKAVEKAITENPQAVADYQSGKKAAVGFLIGQVMKLTSGRADPAITRQLLMEALNQT